MNDASYSKCVWTTEEVSSWEDDYTTFNPLHDQILSWASKLYIKYDRLFLSNSWASCIFNIQQRNDYMYLSTRDYRSHVACLFLQLHQPEVCLPKELCCPSAPKSGFLVKIGHIRLLAKNFAVILLSVMKWLEILCSGISFVRPNALFYTAQLVVDKNNVWLRSLIRHCF